MCARGYKGQNISIGVADEDAIAILLWLETRGLELLERLGGIGHAEERLGAGIGSDGADLNARIGNAGDGEAQTVLAVAGVEAEAGSVELSGSIEIGNRKREAEELIGDAMVTEMQSLVERVAGTGHVLGELGGAAFGIVHGGEHVAGAGFADGRRLEAVGDQGGVERIDVGGLVADVHPAELLRGVGLGIDLKELPVVDLDEDLSGFAGSIGKSEGLLIAKLLEEGDFFVEIADAIGDVGDAVDDIRLRKRTNRAGAQNRERQNSKPHLHIAYRAFPVPPCIRGHSSSRIVFAIGGKDVQYLGVFKG